MLLACRKREHEAAASVLVDGLSGEATGHLPNKFFFGGDHAGIRAAKAERHPEQGEAQREDDIDRERRAQAALPDRDPAIARDHDQRPQQPEARARGADRHSLRLEKQSAE